VEDRPPEVNRKTDKKEEFGIGLDTHYVKKREQQGKLHWIGIFRVTEGEVG